MQIRQTSVRTPAAMHGISHWVCTRGGNRVRGVLSCTPKRLTADSLCAPWTIFVGYASDELDGVDRDAGLLLALPGLPSPMLLKHLPMPAQDCLGLHAQAPIRAKCP